MSALNAVATMAHDVLNHIAAGHDVTDARLAADLATLRINIDRVLGPEPVAGELLTIERHDAEILAVVRSIASHFTVPPPPAPRGLRWTSIYRGATFEGRSPMGSSIQEGFGVDLTAVATDALGEPDPAATIAFASSDPSIVTVVDNGGGSARADITAGATAGSTADVVATVTDPDGNTVDVPYTVTVLAGDATGATITASAPTKTP